MKDISLVLNAICGAFALLTWVHLLRTILNNFKNVKEQLNIPLVSSVFTTFFMSGFLGTTYLNTYFSDVTTITSLITPSWLLCLMGIMIYMIVLSIKYLKGFSLENVYPSWTVLYTGTAIAGLTVPISGFYLTGKLSVIYGFLATCIVLSIVFRRLKTYPLQTSIKPNTSTIYAPFSSVVTTYVITFPKANDLIIIILLVLAQFFYFYIIFKFPKSLKGPFSPVFSAFTFPSVISTAALKDSLLVLTYPEIWEWLLFFEITLAILIVLRVFLGYVHFFFKTSPKASYNS